MKTWFGLCRALIVLAVIGGTMALVAAPVLAQQTGSISGTVVAGDGGGIAGVAVTATSAVLPQARSTTTSANGDYRLPLLPPGEYTLTFTADGMATETRTAQVLLQSNTTVDAGMAPEAVQETVEVHGTTLVDLSSSELKAAVGQQVIDALPVGQEYQDLVKLIPGVQVSNDAVRGPSAGGSGQDNAYQFDGVNVALPLFGTLSADPSSHDIDQISVVKGGANATDFNRSGGFAINSVSKSGTAQYHGQLQYKLEDAGLRSDAKTSPASTAVAETDSDWLTASLGGPILQDRLFFYLSGYSPSKEGTDRSTVYGPVKPYNEERDEYFGKLTFAPTASLLFNGSYRTSDRTIEGRSIDNLSTDSTSVGDESTLDIAIFEGSWIIDPASYLSFKYTDFDNQTSARPDNLASFTPSLAGGRLNVADLTSQGLFRVPVLVPANSAAFNTLAQQLINRYGFDRSGVRTGGGSVGIDDDVTDNDFLRESTQLTYDRSFGGHEVHLGLQHTEDEEFLARRTNGWGLISLLQTTTGTPIFRAAVNQIGLDGVAGGTVPAIVSRFESNSFEINDQFRLADWTFNAGVVVSNDQFFGQGLRPKSGTVSGFELARGNEYKMYEIDPEDMIQPRLGAVWAYDGENTVFVNIARYNPPASSLPRAASWDRNLVRTLNVDFDVNGNILTVAPVSSSSGKFFDDDLKPRTIDEYTIGTARQLTPRWTARANARYRHGKHFWEDTNNDARVRLNPPAGIPRDLYIPNLATVRAEIGGSSYVIAELDGAFTKYYEASLETEWRGDSTYVRASYVWSHYYGNFDQDNTTAENDQNTFIGSSFIADDLGRQLWDNKYGDLRGDRRHQLKVYGYHSLPWHANVGAYAFYQSGQPWEIHDGRFYGATDGSDSGRNAEPAGSRTTDAHYQLDLNYTQDFAISGPFGVALRADVFNVFDRQTGYNIQDRRNFAGFGQPKSFWDPRRIQLAVTLSF